MHASLSADVLTSFMNVQTAFLAASGRVEQLLEQRAAEERGLPRLQRTSPALERNKLLCPFETDLVRAEQCLQQVKVDGKWGQPWAWRAAAQTRKLAEKTLADQKHWIDSTEQIALLTLRVDTHNGEVDQVTKRLRELSVDIANARRWLEVGVQLKEILGRLDETLQRKGWVSAKAITVLDNILPCLLQGNVTTAVELAGKLNFQTMPTLQQIARWKTETTAELEKAREEGSVGFAALATYTAIVTATTELALATCTPQVGREVRQDPAPDDRWYHLAYQLTTPENLVHPVQWALYWAGFKSAQAFSRDLSLAKAHEEHHSGGVLSLFRSEAERWAGTQIDAMGYPGPKALIGTLSLGGGAAEAHLGADFGIIVDINVGGLVVRKVALLQGKLSTNGFANIGSKPSGPKYLTQLQKLNDPERDFYAFYHRGVRHASSPWPTVNWAHALVCPETDLQASSIKVSTRGGGWDWASFVAFGLCSDSSGIGRTVESHEDALDILGGAARDMLPSHLIFVAAGGGDYSLTLRRSVAAHYSDFGTSYKHTMDDDSGPQMKGPRSR